MALLLAWLPYIITALLGLWLYKWGNKNSPVITTETPEADASAAKLKFLKGLGIRVVLLVIAIYLAFSIQTNYGPRLRAEPTPIVQTPVVDKDGNEPQIRDTLRQNRFTPAEAEQRSRETLDWRVAHAKRDAELSAPTKPEQVTPATLDRAAAEALEVEAKAFGDKSPLDSALAKP